MINNEFYPIEDGAGLMTKEIQAVIRRLRLDRLAHIELLSQPAITSEVFSNYHRLKDADMPPVSYGNLAWQAIGVRVWRLLSNTDDTIAKSQLRDEVYEWLGEFIYRRLYTMLNRNVTLTEDLTNESLEKVFRNINNCKQPEAFLKWVMQIAFREVLQYRRKLSRQIQTLSFDKLHLANADSTATSYELEYNVGGKQGEVSPENAEVTATGWSEQSSETSDNTSIGILDPEIYLMRQERIRYLIEMIERLKSNTKRAADYKTILYGTYLYGLDDTELAARLSLSVKEVQKRRSQAIKLLRQNKDAWLEEFT